jgi:hypothetical protein
VQRTERIAAHRRGIGSVGVGKGLIMQNVDNGINLRIDLAQTSEAALDRLAACDFAYANCAGKLAGTPSP